MNMDYPRHVTATRCVKKLGLPIDEQLGVDGLDLGHVDDVLLQDGLGVDTGCKTKVCLERTDPNGP